MAASRWWENRWFIAAMIIASSIPLWWPETPPLVDLPGHMARYRVQLDLGSSPSLQRYFDFEWALIGNLGVDLIIQVLGQFMPLETAVKAVVIVIPPLTVGGIFWIAREFHGRIPPTTLFAIPFVYGFPFNFGFLNFSLSVAFALLAFALWLRMSRDDSEIRRALLFLPLGCVIWVTHVFGWGVLGLLALSSEWIRQREPGRSRWWVSKRTMIALLPLAAPLILMAVWRSADASGETDSFFAIIPKLYSLVAVLRDRWLIWDSFGVAASILLIASARFDRHLRISPALAVPALVLAVTFVIMPGRVFGSAYADMRLGPLMFIFGILSISVRENDERISNRLAWLGLTFALLRLAGNTASFALADRDMRRWLTALDLVPMGSPVLALVGEYCGQRWEMPRHTHVGSFVVSRKLGYSNDQWQAAGAQLLRIHYPQAKEFVSDRSAFVYSKFCVRQLKKAEPEVQADRLLPERVLDRFPRPAFDFVWMVQPADFQYGKRPGLTPVWSTNDAILYKVDR